MGLRNDSPNIRKGRFLWMDDTARAKYLDTLKRKIAEGYFYSDAILGKVVDEIAPVMGEQVDSELGSYC